MMKFHKSKALIAVSCIVAIVLTLIEQWPSFQAAVFTDIWESLVCLFLYQFATIALLFLAISRHIDRLKKLGSSDGELENIEKLFLVFQIVLVVMLVATFIDISFGIVFFISNITLLGVGAGAYCKTKTEYSLTLLFWCIALQFLFETFSLLTSSGLACGYMWTIES